jgi:hypothetical protein
VPLSLPDYHARTAKVREIVGGQLVALWSGLGSYRDANVDRFVRLAVPKVQAGQIATARLTAQYLGGPVLPRQTIVTSRPADPGVVYRRPAVKLYTLLGAGVVFDDAVRQATRLVGDLAATDMQLALRAQSRMSLEAGGHTRYRRVLTGREDCDRCRLAAMNTYSSADLLPIHGRCDCTVEPIQGDAAPEVDLSGLALSSARADEVAAGVAPESLVAVREHGELGPVVVWASDHFTGPDDLAA